MEYDLNNKYWAYFLGFFWGDGCFGANGKPTTPKVTILKSDADVIFPVFAQILSFQYREYTQPNGKVASVALFNFDRKNLMKLLADNDYLSKAISPHTKILKNIPENLHNYFWRGFFDADGCFFKTVNGSGGVFSVVSDIRQDWSAAKKMFSSIQVENLQEYRDVEKNGNKSSKLILANGKGIKKLFYYLYPDGFDFGLERKFLKASEILNSLSPFTSSHTGISWNKKDRKWTVTIKRKYLGRFENIKEALEVKTKYLTRKAAA